MSHGYAFVKDKALSLPLALFGRDFFQIFQDAAFEMINLRK